MTGTPTQRRFRLPGWQTGPLGLTLLLTGPAASATGVAIAPLVHHHAGYFTALAGTTLPFTALVTVTKKHP